MSSVKEKYLLFLAFAAIYVIWGTTYFAILVGLETIPPFMLASIRYLIAGILLLGLCFIKKENILSASPLNNIILGAFILTFGQAIMFWAEKYISSGLTAIFGATLPICYLIADTRNWKSNFKSKLTLFSIFLGLIGIILLFITPNDTTYTTHTTHTPYISQIASLVCILGCYCWAAGSLYFTYRPRTGSLFLNVGWQLVGGVVCCFIISLLTGEINNFSLARVSFRSWSAVLYLSIAGSITAFITLYWLLDRRPAPVVGTYAYVNPVIAVLIGFLFAGEIITKLQLAGMIIILLAAWLANKVKFKNAIVAKP